MTVPCPPGVITLGTCPGYLRICAKPGALLSGAVQQLDKFGIPLAWTPGTSAWLEITSGGFEATYAAAIDGSFIRFNVLGTETAKWPRGACAAIWVQFPDTDGPIPWVEGHVERGCC